MQRNIFLVVNTNILFSFFGKSTKTRELIFFLSGKLISPEFAIKEVIKHKDEVLRKAKIEKKEFKELVSVLRKHVIFVKEDFYSEFIPIALKICPDPDDADFVALALKTGVPLWSNDRKLKTISEITVLNTREVVSLIKTLGLG